MSATAMEELRLPLAKPTSYPVAAGEVLIEGELAYLDRGYLTSNPPPGCFNLFAGIVRRTVGNTAGKAGDCQAYVWTEGDAEVDTAGAVQSWVGNSLQGISRCRVAIAGGRVTAGTCIRVLSPTRVVMRLATLRN